MWKYSIFFTDKIFPVIAIGFTSFPDHQNTLNTTCLLQPHIKDSICSCESGQSMFSNLMASKCLPWAASNHMLSWLSHCWGLRADVWLPHWRILTPPPEEKISCIGKKTPPIYFHTWLDLLELLKHGMTMACTYCHKKVAMGDLDKIYFIDIHIISERLETSHILIKCTLKKGEFNGCISTPFSSPFSAFNTILKPLTLKRC